MPACDLDRSLAFCFYNKREKPNTLVSVFSGEVHLSLRDPVRQTSPPLASESEKSFYFDL